MNNVTAEMVEQFQINENYLEKFPCTHTCQIVLMDGRKVKVAIDGPEIHILIQAIAKEKIVFKRTEDKDSHFRPQTLDHFKCYGSNSYSEFNNSKAPLPNELLSSLFKNQSS